MSPSRRLGFIGGSKIFAEFMHPCFAGFLGLRSGVDEVCVLEGRAAASMGNWS